MVDTGTFADQIADNLHLPGYPNPLCSLPNCLLNAHRNSGQCDSVAVLSPFAADLSPFASNPTPFASNHSAAATAATAGGGSTAAAAAVGANAVAAHWKYLR